MDIIFFDLEVFKHDWTVTFKSLKTGEYTFIHNNNHKVREFLSNKKLLLCGWNNKYYDDHILSAIIEGADNYTLKKLNDWIIVDRKLPWEFPFLQGVWRDFQSFDIRDDLYKGLSLKEAEGNMGMDIEESEVDFNIDRPLTKEELEEVRKYNRHDVDATERVFLNRKEYLRAKVHVGRMINLETSISMTNGKLSAKFLEATKISRNDERDFKYPKNLNMKMIPKPILDFYNRILDKEIDDFELFNGPTMIDDGGKRIKVYKYFKKNELVHYGKKLSKKDIKEKGITHWWYKGKLTLFLKGNEYIYGFGGVHAGVPNYVGESTKDRKILLWDVRSLYPSIMIEYDLLSRNTPVPEKFKKIYYDRIKAKKEGDKATSDALKLILNTSYGITLNKYNDMFDPRQGRMVCIYGQLFLTELLIRLMIECPSLEMINFNTDGVMFAIDKEELDKAYEISEEWQKRTRFVLEEDVIDKIVQKDVNNYCMKTGGKIETKGAMVSNYKGGDMVNNSLTVVHNALVDYLLYDKPVEKTINEETDILNFQMIAKTGSTYSKTFHTINGEKIEVQKVNRVYATKDKKYGTIHKFKIDENGKERYDKIANLPENCIVDNTNKLSLDDIDKDFYIEMAEKRIKQYLGIK